MYIYNTLKKEKEEFIPQKHGEVSLYVCGPTVYDLIHIGNARPICVFDVLKRYLEYRGMKVNHVQNFTDIDDKIIRRSQKEGCYYQELAEHYINEYFMDAETLNVLPASYYLKASNHIEGMIEMISSLLEKGYAYIGSTGNVYFRSRNFESYGKLSRQSLDGLRSGSRIQVDEKKEDPLDFILWKTAKLGEPSWESPFGKGRPGWHIECSVMAAKYLGKTLDIHGGGQDLIFPHHENEIAQSEACYQKPLARYWMHNGYINIDNRKMSKSEGNFFTVRDIGEKYGYDVIRYLMVSSHYRMPINYSIDMIEQCKSSLEKLYTCRDNLKFMMEHAKAEEGDQQQYVEIQKQFLQYRNKFIAAMENDLNTADAVSAIFELVREINSNLTPKINPSLEICHFVLDLFEELLGILGLLYVKKEIIMDQEFEELIRMRNKAREEKNWAEADRIRSALKEHKVILEDTQQGVRWKIEK